MKRRSNGNWWNLLWLGAAALALLASSLKGQAEEGSNWGLFNSQAKSHIDAPDAWKIERGKPEVIVAVIDTGIDPNHKDLKASLWHETPEVWGWNFITDKANPIDEHGHGTHIAGIIHAVAPGVRILTVKYYSDANPGSVNLKNTVKALNYAIDHGAKIINYSGGGPEFSEDEYMALRKAEAKDILIVAAAGNEHQNVDKQENYYYPGSYRAQNEIVVAATDIRNNLLATSNWGKRRVDVAAPGENIFSDLPNDRQGYMSGTSQATAFVTGIAALILSHTPGLKPAEIRAKIMESVDRFPQLENRVVSGGRVNAYSALLR